MVVVSVLQHTEMDQNAQKTAISRRLGKKLLGQRLADWVGWVIKNTGLFFFFLALVQVATLLMFEPFYKVHTGMVE